MESREVLPPSWSLPKRLLFRFTFAYWVIYLFPTPAGEFLHGTGWFAERYTKLWEAIVPWFGAHVLGIDVNVSPNGSGDTTYFWVQLLIHLSLALLATTLWSALDRKPRAYPRMHEGLRVYVRYCLFAIMIAYGLAKVFLLQFPFPEPDRLVQTYGESSPMRLLWTFLGSSEGYNYFTGGIEVLAGLLFLSRRTTTLGAIFTAGVMANIMALNFCYDVPVKLFSSHLFLMAVFLAAPDLGRLVDFFVLNRPTAPSAPRPWHGPRWVRHASLGLEIVVVVWIGWSQLSDAAESAKQYGVNAPRPPLAGLYAPEPQQISTGKPAWQYVVIGGYRNYPRVTIRDHAGHAVRYKMAYDEATRTLTLTDKDDNAYGLRVAELADGGLALSGRLGETDVEVRLVKVDTRNFLLVNRGFHWVSEVPFNR